MTTEDKEMTVVGEDPSVEEELIVVEEEPLVEPVDRTITHSQAITHSETTMMPHPVNKSYGQNTWIFCLCLLITGLIIRVDSSRAFFYCYEDLKPLFRDILTIVGLTSFECDLESPSGPFSIGEI